ncbi:hypothetical protein M0Q50_03415 [bacterium]|jgi:hypothetical protein|nr:hypothetical protein [bacterium]
MNITEYYITESDSSEFIGIELPCKVTCFQNPINVLVKRYESNNKIVWRQNDSYGEYITISNSEYFDLRYKQYQISLRCKKIKSL